MSIDEELRAAFAPTGTLRASINLGNPILAGADPVSGRPIGVSVDLAHGLARSLGLPIKFVVFDSAGKSVDAVASEHADFGFFAIDPLRGASIAFTAPYVMIEGCYLVCEGARFHANDEVDAEGVQVTVGKGSAYDLYLTRELRHASITRASTSPAVVDTFIELGLDVAAGVKQQLEADARRVGGLRLLPGRFMVIRQAMGLPRSRGALATAFLARYVEEMKASGFVAESLARHQIVGASVAPAQAGEG
jgi:polar amino acid transport system substrate-binding protein